MNKFKILLLNVVFITFLFFSLNSFSQQKIWNAKINTVQSIIENNGQFPDINGTKVLYAFLGNKEKFYFTNKGLIIRLDTVLFKRSIGTRLKEIFSNKESEEKDNAIEKFYLLYSEWQNINTDIKIETSDKTEGYFTFGIHKNICNGYKRVIYKNIYPNIDIEYFIPEEKTGIKYNIILHPGADISNISLKYSGDVNQMTMDNNGNIIIKTPLHNIVEHSPKSFYSADLGDVASSYLLQNNLITFYISDTNSDKTIIIDPWVSGLLMSGNDWGYDVDYDSNNNLYVYVHDYTNSVLCIKKYSSLGNLEWTHLTSTYIADYEGNFMVEKLSNKVYISDGYCSVGDRAYRLDVTGIADGYSSQQNPNFEEIWDIAYDNNSNRIIALGGGTTSNLNGGIINPTTGTVWTANFTGLQGEGQDITCNTIDDNGNLFVVYAYSSFGSNGHLISLVNSTLNGHIWQVSHGMYGFQELSNHCPNNTCAFHSNAYNGLDANNSYLYYYDGGGLAAYNKSTGSQIAATSVGFSGTWYTPLYQGGIAVDDCNNIYLGGNNSNILIYNFNGTSFTQTGNIPLGWSGNQTVFDIKLDKTTNYLFVSGHSNVGVYAAPLNCNILQCIIDNIVIDSIGCVQNNFFDLAGSIYISTPPDSSTLTITDQSSGISQIIQPPFTNQINFQFNNLPFSTLQHVIKTSFSGSYNCNYSVNYNLPQEIMLSGNIINSSCGNNNGTAIVNIISGGIPSYSYQWSTGTSTINTTNTTNLISGLAAGVYIVTVTNGNGCITTKIFNINDGTHTVAIIQNQQPRCNGLCDGILTANVSGSGLISPYNYVWSNGQSHSISNSISDTCLNLCAGLVSVTVTDSIGCHAVSSIVLEQPNVLTSTVTSFNPSCIGNSNGSSLINVNGGITPYTYLWSNGQTSPLAINLTDGNYSVTVNDANNCSITNSTTIVNPQTINAGFTFLSDSLSVQFTNTSSANSIYLWHFGDGSTSTLPNPYHTFPTNGTYNVCLTVQNQCDSIVTCQNITVNLLNINEIDINDFSVYPNPAHDNITIKFAKPGYYKLEIIDVLGKPVKTFEDSFSGEILLNKINLSTGNYLIKLTNIKENTSLTKSLIIK
ncbi:MAG: T9SS type A sorting domain-containing protein [Bacteroidia bacterium]|nr:T9SS type A sorting domain-containing protein [Bacteroidia bacterium]